MSAAASAASVATRTPEQLARQVLEAFEGPIKPVRVGLMYRLAALLVAVVMVLLPVAYAGLIALVGWLVYLHAVHDVAIVGAVRGRGAIFALIVYLGPIVAGGILLVFMLKPFFAKPARRGRTRSLTATSDPLLFAFVERVCQSVGARRPKRIDVNCEVNASAGFRRGMLSMLGNDLVLTIGVPLAAGLNLNQFAGVLAHEFGHFTQGAGMRLTYIVRSISWWLTRVVYQRDVWDEWLVRWCKETDIRIGIVFYLARLFVWLTRKILWGLMLIGHAVAGFLLRQMEFAADRHEIRLVGSDVFESTARRLAVLNVAYSGAQSDLSDFYREGRLGDNLPKLLVANIGQIPAKILTRINEAIDDGKTGLLDTHPSDKDRIAAARRENAAGVFHFDAPATTLFDRFDALSENVTTDLYHGLFGKRFDPAIVRPVEQLLQRQGQDLEASKAATRYYQGMLSLVRPVWVPRTVDRAPADPREAAERLKRSRQEMLDAKDQYAEFFAQYDEADTQKLEADQAVAMFRAKSEVKPDDFSVPMTTRERARAVRERAETRQAAAGAKMQAFETALGERLIAAMELLYVPKVAARIENAPAIQSEVAAVLPVLAAVGRCCDAILQLRNDHAALAILVGKLQERPKDVFLADAVQAQAVEIQKQIERLIDGLNTVYYPFDHEKKRVTLREYALAGMPEEPTLAGIYHVAVALVKTLHELYYRMASRLAMTAERVESLLGLPPLPEPPQKEAEGQK
ncbi:MAG: M48 family metalloprotease [Pirellulales bacterium]|nr:M48 family metalloprotease [Pirellulales bacterium]